MATNWKVALGDAQVQLEAVVKPKVEAAFWGGMKWGSELFPAFALEID